MASSEHTITVHEAVKITGLSRRVITYAITTGAITARKLPGRTGAYLVDPHEVRTFASLHRASA